jgi:hypothetical protein
MQPRAVIAAALASTALFAAAGARAGTNEAYNDAYLGPGAYRTAVFWSPADRLWSGDLAPEACLRSGRKASLIAAPRLQAARFEQSGELVGEILSTPELAPRVIAQAKSCAIEADSATTTQALLTETERNWGTFRSAFSACLTRNKTAQYVGSMTLWIDRRCDW